ALPGDAAGGRGPAALDVAKNATSTRGRIGRKPDATRREAMRRGDLRMALIVVALALGACGERTPTEADAQAPPDRTPEPSEQRYGVVFTDLRGERIADGELALPGALDGEFEGRWSLTPVAEEGALPSGSGQIAGRRDGDDI